MIGILASIVIGQASPVMSAEEIQRRLETPITYHSDPVRLSVALDEIGGMVGVRIRCEQGLQPAVVVIGVRAKPAKEVVQHLMNGVGAGSIIQAGTLHVGMRLQSEEQAAKQRELELKAIKATIENRAKALKIDQPLDPDLPARVAQHTIITLQSPVGDYRPPHVLIYNATAQSPAARASAGLLNAIGPELLQLADERPKTVDLRSLNPEQAVQARKVLAQYEAEQAVWAAPFEPVFKMLASTQYVPISEDLLQRSLPLAGAKPDNFRVRIVPERWARIAYVEILAGGATLIDTTEYLPKQRTYTDPGGEYFQISKANQMVVPLGDKVKRLESTRRRNQDGTAKAYDWPLMRLLADPWRNEPLSFMRAQPMAAVADKLNLNLVTYLGDGLINWLLFDNGVQGETARGDQVLQYANQGSVNGLRKKGDWLIGYCSNPEEYLANQLDRNALGQFLVLANRPGALTFQQMLNARKQLGMNQLQIARQFARLIRPGFDSLNPANMEVLDLFAKLSSGQLSMAKGSGIPVASLDEDLERQFRRYAGYQRRRSRYGIPDDSIDATPTLEDYRKSKIVFAQDSVQGLIFLEGSTMQRRTFTPYAYYNFQGMESYRGYGSAATVAATFTNRICWPARMDTLRFSIVIPRKRPQGLSTVQYITDVSVEPLSTNQVLQAVQRYFQGS